MKFSADFIDKVRDANDIVDVISPYVQLQKVGARLRGLCPFPGHNERTPSFYVGQDKQLYHCFGCKKSGNIFTFLSEFQGMSFPEAVEYLAQRASIPLPEPELKNQDNTHFLSGDEKKTLFKLNKYVGAIYHRNLMNKPRTDSVWKYIFDRGLTEETVVEFKLGYSQPGWDDLTKALKRGGAPLAFAEKLVLIKRKSNNEFFDVFRDRLMFPILSSTGNVVGFGGRTLSDQTPKYLNSSESPVFHKGKTFYGLHATAKYIRSENEVFVVEGYMDLLALYQHGIKNVVAPLGTAFTPDHAKILQKLCGRVIMLFDGDDAGIEGANKVLPLLLDAGVFSRCMVLPEKLDPDDFLKNYGVDEFRKRAQEAPDHFLAFLGSHLKEYRAQPTQKVEVLNVITPLLQRVRDQRLKGFYLQEVADRLGLETKWLEQQTRPSTPQTVEFAKKNPVEAVTENIPREEQILVQFMLRNPELLETVRSSGVIDLFASSTARELATRIIEKYCQNPNDFDRLAASLTTQGSSHELLTSHIAIEVYIGDLDEVGEKQLLQDCLMRVKDRQLKRQSKSLLNALKLDANSTTEELEHFMKIAKEHKGLKNP